MKQELFSVLTLQKVKEKWPFYFCKNVKTQESNNHLLIFDKNNDKYKFSK